MFTPAWRYFTLLALVSSLKVFALEVGDTAPCVVLDDVQVDGSVISQCIRTPKIKGQFVVIDFFTSKCDDCALNVTPLNALAGDIASSATTRMVGSDRDAQSLQGFLEQHHSDIRVPVSLDTEVQAQRAYGVTAMPTVFVLNTKNKILFKHVGILSDADVAAIKKIVK